MLVRLPKLTYLARLLMFGQGDDGGTQISLVDSLCFLVLGNDAVVGGVELDVGDTSSIFSDSVLLAIELELNLLNIESDQKACRTKKQKSSLCYLREIRPFSSRLI